MLREDLDKPLVADLLDRFAHGSARDAQPGGDVDLVDRRAGRKLAGDDGPADERIDLVAQRDRPVQGHSAEECGQAVFAGLVRRFRNYGPVLTTCFTPQ